MTAPVAHHIELLAAKKRLIAEGYSDVFDTAVFLETDREALRTNAKDTPYRQRLAMDDTDEEIDTPVSGAPLQLTTLDHDDDHKTKVMLQHLNQDLSMSDKWIDRKLKDINRKLLRGEY